MTDFELNKAIAEALELKIIEWYDGQFTVNKDGLHTKVDYCNNWNDLMPLVVEHRIELRELSPSIWWHAFHARSGFEGKDENPQRALALCLLKVLESKND